MSALIDNNEVHIMSLLFVLKNIAALNKHNENFCKLKPGILYTLIKVENLFKCKISMHTYLICTHLSYRKWKRGKNQALYAIWSRPSSQVLSMLHICTQSSITGKLLHYRVKSGFRYQAIPYQLWWMCILYACLSTFYFGKTKSDPVGQWSIFFSFEAQN